MFTALLHAKEKQTFSKKDYNDNKNLKDKRDKKKRQAKARTTNLKSAYFERCDRTKSARDLMEAKALRPSSMSLISI